MSRPAAAGMCTGAGWDFVSKYHRLWIGSGWPSPVVWRGVPRVRRVRRARRRFVYKALLCESLDQPRSGQYRFHKQLPER